MPQLPRRHQRIEDESSSSQNSDININSNSNNNRLLREAEDVSDSIIRQEETQDEEAISQQLPSSSPPPASSPASGVHRIRKRNIRLILTYTWIIFAGRSIWNQNVLATFCFLLSGKDPKLVGYLTAAMGICQLLVSFPVGYLADKYRRDHLLKLASCIGMVAAGTTLKVLFWNGHQHQPTYSALMFSLCIWGCFWGIANTCLTAVFADSIENGERSKYFTKRSILINLGNLSGPTVALTMFLILGNEWTLMDCAYVMGTGQIICLPAMVLLCFLKDPQWQEQQESRPEDCDDMVETSRQEEDSLRTPLLSDLEEEADDERSIQANGRQGTSTPPETRPHRDETYNASKLASMLSYLCGGCCLHSDGGPPKRIIPSLVASADVLSGLASGMSIRYFAIFLYDNLHLKPVHVQLLYIIAPLLQACLAKLGQVLAKSYGRCKVTVAFKWIGVSFMMAMVTVTKLSQERIENGDKLVIAMICTLMVIRTGFMNATSALTKSVLMDYVPNDERAKWSALESFNMFSWSGSAALGGILVDYHGILFNFCITASLQFVATWPHLLLARAAVLRTNENENNTHNHPERSQIEVDRSSDRSNTDGRDRRDAIA
ncbi:unnamed protein product [Cylindrotheca closterium]|uniref:Major facilitator superfamily associated domain-containing protein n=1 Tax=Cylindrotheca closterium TaxID=2856 RepID=A0AAD2G292_9STRA|nr:unnamed protein product [Cylindrotheca closterium]